MKLIHWMVHNNQYDQLYSNSTWNGSSADLNIYLYPNGSDEEGAAVNVAAPAIQDAAEQLLDNGSIGEYNIYLSDNQPGLNYQSKSDYYNRFSDWLDREGHLQETGCHLAICNYYTGGIADIPRDNGGSSFENGNVAVMGSGGNTTTVEQGSIMEPLHTFIRHDYNDVTALIRNEDAFHDFGTILHSNKQCTPMATGYTGPDSAVTNGECGNGYWYPDTHTTQLTDCTKKAVKITGDKDA